MIDTIDTHSHEIPEKPSTLVRIRQNGVRLFCRRDYTPKQIESFLSLIEEADQLADNSHEISSLSGRVPMITSNVEDIGPVVVKSYRRGGLLGLFLSSTHARVFETRSRLEFNILSEARKVGINAPEPLAYIERGEFLYQAWLITKQIEGGMNLLDYSKEYPSMITAALSALADELRKLIQQKIHHIDLHPGNVVIIGDASSVKSAWIVDFDKAYQYSGDKNILRDKYLRRWRRAVIKHRLPEVYSEVISLALREHF